MAPPLFILAVILYVVSATAVKALVFDVPSGSSKCLTEELHRRAVSHASYRVVAESTSAADRMILVRVTGPRGEELYMAEGGERGEFRFEAAEDGEHTACFWSPRYERGAVVSVDVHWATTSVGAHAGGVRIPARRRGCQRRPHCCMLPVYTCPMQHEARRHDTKHEKKARHEPGTAR
jgi:hypothetical protein